MNEQIKAKWVDALGSGEYSQAIGCLQDFDGGFCCLGVLSDLHVKESNAKWIRVGNTFGYANVSNERGEIAILPKEVRDWSGFDTVTGDLDFDITDREGMIYGSLAELNDHGFTFEQISDFIKAFV